MLFGLLDAYAYDLQVRAVTGTDGSWSATVQKTPTEPGRSRLRASTLPLDIPLGGDLDPANDLDYYKFTLTEETGVILHTLGATDTLGELYDRNDNLLKANDDGGLVGEPRNFLIWHTLEAGTYYLRVALYVGGSPTPGPYAVLEPAETRLAVLTRH